MVRRSEIISWLLCALFIILFVLFIVWLCYFVSFSCKAKETELLFKGLNKKLCKDSDFSARVFEDEDPCCRLIRMTICTSSRLRDDLEESCSGYNDFIPFMRYCLPKTSAIDLYEITKTSANEYPSYCSPKNPPNYYYHYQHY